MIQILWLPESPAINDFRLLLLAPWLPLTQVVTLQHISSPAQALVATPYQLYFYQTVVPAEAITPNL